MIIHFPNRAVQHRSCVRLHGSWHRSKALATAYYNLLWVGVLSVQAVGTGVLAWQWLLKGTPLRGALLLHIVLGTASTALLLLVSWVQYRTRKRSDQNLPVYQGLLELFGHRGSGTDRRHLGRFLS